MKQSCMSTFSIINCEGGPIIIYPTKVKRKNFKNFDLFLNILSFYVSEIIDQILRLL